MLPGGGHIICQVHDLDHVSWYRFLLQYTDPEQPFIRAGYDLDDLERDISDV